MRQVKWGPRLLAAAMMVFAGATMAASTVDVGKREYNAKCASCHGLTGKGDGSYEPLLTVRASDLTVITKKNNGVFPVEKVIQAIDGRAGVKAHGSREMPIWGRDYTLEAGELYFDMPFDADAYVRAKILKVADGLKPDWESQPAAWSQPHSAAER